MALQGRSSSTRVRNERRNALLSGYRPLPGAYDELMAADGTIRPQWEPFLAEWSALSSDELQRRFGLADRHVRDTGVSYRVHGDLDENDLLASERPRRSITRRWCSPGRNGRRSRPASPSARNCSMPCSATSTGPAG